MTETVQFNPSTLKVSYDSITDKVQLATFDLCLACEGYCPVTRGADNGLCCFTPGQVPKYLCLRIGGGSTKRCSDDSVIGAFGICCEQIGSSLPESAQWLGTTMLGGVPVTGGIDFSGIAYPSEIAVWDTTNGYYYGRYEGSYSCFSHINDYVKADCGTLVPSSYLAGGSKICVLYGGGCVVCDPLFGGVVYPCL